MATPAGDLQEVPDALFSEGTRFDGNPKRPTESAFAFADRVRQPYFDRRRRWLENAFCRYPKGSDRVDLRARIRSPNDRQHGAAEWELYQHELWRCLGWQLTPHPDTPDGRRRDFLVQRGDTAFILECAVDYGSLQQAGRERRWGELWAAFKELSCPNHMVMVHRRAIGTRSLSAASLASMAQRELDLLLRDETAVVLKVDTDGWRFRIEATPHHPLAGVVVDSSGGGMSMEERLYNPIRNRVKEKSKGSPLLEQTFVLALLVVNDMPIVSEAGAVREALMGTQNEVLGLHNETAGSRPKHGAPWVEGGMARGKGLSAVLLQQGDFLGGPIPVLHHHPDPSHRFGSDNLPFEQVRYDVADTRVEHHQSATATWHEVFSEDPLWPGPELPYEGIHSDGPLPVPRFWSPISPDIATAP